MTDTEEAKNLVLVAVREAAEHARASLSAPALLSQEEAWTYCSISKSEWFRLRAEGSLPEPVGIPNVKRPRWRKADLDAWIAQLPKFES